MSRLAWAEAIGADLNDDGVPSRASIASHIRAALASEGHLSSHRIVRGLKEAYAPFGADDKQVHEAIHAVLDALVDIGDLTRFAASAGAAYVATPERLVALGGDSLAVLGASPLAISVGESLVRRLSKTENSTSVPVLALVDEIGFADWRLHLVSAGGTDAPSADPSALFFYLAGLAASGERLERLGSADLRVIAGSGEFFGNGRAIALEGRWKEWRSGGSACALRKRAYGWQPCVVAETAQGPRIYDVADHDCWKWAVVGQIRSKGEAVAKRTGEVFQCLTPPPRQVRRLLTLVGEPDGPWRWRVASDATDLAERLLGQAEV